MSKAFFFTGFYLFLSLLFLGCDSNRIYEEKVDLDKRIWPKQKEVKFNFEIADTTAQYNLYYILRYTNKYPYQNLYLQYYLEDSTGRVLNKELNNVVLFNPVTGIPTGTGLGDILTLQKRFIDHFTFPRPGLYGIGVEQFMRLDTLPEIITVGIRVERSGEEDR